MKNAVTASPAAPSTDAFIHFSKQFSFETDCWDTHEALQSESPGFVLLDVRNAELFANGHVPGAIHLPHGKIVKSKMAQWPQNTLFVVYCAGPHCNGAAKAAIRLAKLERPVKLMTGGVTGWLDEGFPLNQIRK
ncbi:rhodanese-like domain-containing protein [Thalassotalea sp. M1531]|uniref:Rhodanese-like domain-containing protein n=1 Tax=Thalassotalea algicola TaxID=2716224 RepID=A0A7Y0L9E9_9GAMM|nr:rhodanese-like domain-containing protein [Thalassotalea algicola]NMP30388.1 rhodanese-like domain-containing protein [Thalassotalea algicola]